MRQLQRAPAAQLDRVGAEFERLRQPGVHERDVQPFEIVLDVQCPMGVELERGQAAQRASGAATSFRSPIHCQLRAKTRSSAGSQTVSSRQKRLSIVAARATSGSIVKGDIAASRGFMPP